MQEKDFLFLAGNRLAAMRLTIESAALTYTDEVMRLYRRAVSEGSANDALSLDLIGAALFLIREQITELQTVYMQMMIEQEKPQ